LFLAEKVIQTYPKKDFLGEMYVVTGRPEELSQGCTWDSPATATKYLWNDLAGNFKHLIIRNRIYSAVLQ